jgi:polysaccharide chain length determinant protein (PEP-CTERM system associated)
MNSDLAYILRVIRKEVWANRRLVIAIYLLSSFAFLAAAWTWPRIYTSSSTILIGSESVLKDLMQGAAETTAIIDNSRRARQIILNKKSINKVLKLDAWQNDIGVKSSGKLTGDDSKNIGTGELASSNKESEISSSKELVDTKSKITTFEEITDQEFEALAMIIRQNTEVSNIGGNMIEISYKDASPQKAFQTANLMTDIFVEGSMLAQQSESGSAFEFIDNQVSIYKQQLQASEQAIEEFKSKNVEATPEAKTNAEAKLVSLDTELEAAELEKSEAEATILTMQRQLSGDNKIDENNVERETALNGRIIELEERLNELLLSYKETYPDVVQLKNQIKQLRSQVSDEVISREDNSSSSVNRKPTGTVAQQLRQQILVSESRISTLDNRIEQLKLRIESEKDTLAEIIAVEGELTELARDYAINQEMYNDLLQRRERARVSMNIDREKQGLSMNVEERASLPYVPQGLRFAHIILAGLVLSFLIPAGTVFLLAEFDQKVRGKEFFKEVFVVPVLASVYAPASPQLARQNKMKFIVMVSVVLLVWTVYASAIFIRSIG